jgi:hypothetical protein
VHVGIRERDHAGMHRKPYVFRYEAEPADERPTGYGTDFDLALACTEPAPWRVTEHSTFDEPSHALDRVAALRRARAFRAKLGVATAALIGAAAIASVAVLL